MILALCAIALVRAPVPEPARQAIGGPAPAGQAQTAGRSPVSPVRFPADVVPAVQAPHRVTTVGLAAAKAPVDWDESEEIRTVDGAPGGKLQWDPETGRVRVCDIEEDGKLVRGYVTRGGEELAAVRAGGKGSCDEHKSGYNKKLKYEIKVCLYENAPGKGEGYCNISSAGKGGMWPKAKYKEDHCDKFEGQKLLDCRGGDNPCDSLEGPAGDYCQDGSGSGGGTDSGDLYSTEKPDVPAAPKGAPAPSINDRPDNLPRNHAGRAEWVAEPLGKTLRWLLWLTLGACVFGFIMVGGKMALKHKRGEAGAHAAGLGWVLIACAMVGSGLVVGLISLLIDPL